MLWRRPLPEFRVASHFIPTMATDGLSNTAAADPGSSPLTGSNGGLVMRSARDRHLGVQSPTKPQRDEEQEQSTQQQKKDGSAPFEYGPPPYLLTSAGNR